MIMKIKNVIICCLRYIVVCVVVIPMYWLFYTVTDFIWALLTNFIPFILAIIPSIIVWLFLQYGVFWKVLKPLRVNRNYYLIINILGLTYTFITKYISYLYFLETTGYRFVSEKFQHLMFLQEILLTLISLLVIIYTWKNNYRRTKTCGD